MGQHLLKQYQRGRVRVRVRVRGFYELKVNCEMKMSHFEGKVVNYESRQKCLE